MLLSVTLKDLQSQQTSRQIDADSVRRTVVSAACATVRRSACYGVGSLLSPAHRCRPRDGFCVEVPHPAVMSGKLLIVASLAKLRPVIQQAISGTRTAVPTAQELPFQRTWPEPRIGYGHKAARRQWCRPHRLSSNGAAPGCRPRGHCAGRSSTGHRDAVPLRPRSLRPRCLLREGRSLQHVGVADHAVTLEAPWTGSG